MKVLTARQFSAWQKTNTIPEDHFVKTFDNWWYTRAVEGQEIDDRYTEGVLVVWAVRAYSATKRRRGTVLKALVMDRGYWFEPHLGYADKAVPAIVAR